VTLQHIQKEEPFFSLPKKRSTWSANHVESPILRVWLPSRWRWPFNPWQPLSAPNALGLRSSELFSDPMIHSLFPMNVPLWRFAIKLKELDTGASAV
jgi:hypothetical protein